MSVDAITDAFSIKVHGRVFAYLYPRRRHFLLGTYDEDGEWFTIAAKSAEDYERAVKAVKRCFEEKM